MHDHDVDESLLPGILQEITALIGLPATLKLTQKYGGVRLYVPKHLPEDHVLADLIGLEAARKLAEHYGGLVHFDIPKADAIRIALRNSKIRAEWPTLSQRQLALKYSLTERQVRKILAIEQQDEPRQMGLF
ncbi:MULTISPECIES: Mor transcription activator family protein [Nitrosomonas]|uniref:Mor transcription activator family protein n=1 Tax=Nitrosomonas communis TaxID=44574 RepID=A0A0F7KEM2_9PROT|nr:MULTISPECIES: Mor transcription activator family protein [Nitrosomonas]AKH37279.1 hypothetical protein AAW31_04830 [Nitrosomonas communis]TYP84710.1 Mor transcription activator family protein [Nitrosomonas communis]UVS62487.1 hypothetical protein NX761_05025 [Nitrosomonas sp. PLL12]